MKKWLALFFVALFGILTVLAVVPIKKAYAEMFCVTVTQGSPHTYRAQDCNNPSWPFERLAQLVLGHGLQDGKCYAMPIEVPNIQEVDINSQECQNWKQSAFFSGASPPVCKDFNGDIRDFDGWAFPIEKISDRACDDAAKREYGINSFANGSCYILGWAREYRTISCSILNDVILPNAQQNFENAQARGSIGGGSASPCASPRRSFFGLPTWYEFLDVGPNCAIKIEFNEHPEQIWLIGLAIADILITLAGGIAVFFVIIGGYRYITSQFDPEGTKKARDTIINALIGLVIVILSSAIVNFVGNTLR
jgi:hypothetical protein